MNPFTASNPETPTMPQERLEGINTINTINTPSGNKNSMYPVAKRGGLILEQGSNPGKANFLPAPLIAMDTVFEHPLVKAAGLELQPAYPLRLLMLELHQPRLGYPFPLIAMEENENWLKERLDQGQIRGVTEEEMAEVIFILCVPMEECCEALEISRAHFRSEAVRRVQNQLPEILIQELFNNGIQVLLTWKTNRAANFKAKPQTTEAPTT